jgi:hypothetical protein
MSSKREEEGSEASAKGSPADQEQSRRFIEAARELGCEGNLDRFDEAARRVLSSPPQPHKPKKRS